MKTRKPLQSVGRRARRTAEAREEMRQRVLAECGRKCVGVVTAPEVRCYGNWLEVHELVDRAVRPGSELEWELGVCLCPAHHRLYTTDEDLAREHGLTFRSWEWEQALERARQLRSLVWRS